MTENKAEDNTITEEAAQMNDIGKLLGRTLAENRIKKSLIVLEAIACFLIDNCRSSGVDPQEVFNAGLLNSTPDNQIALHKFPFES